MGGGQPSAPSQRDPVRDYQRFIDLNIQSAPKLLQAEQELRGQYDPQRIQEQQILQYLYGPTQYQQQLDALNQLDPHSQEIRGQLAGEISRDLRSGYGLPEGYDRELTSQYRGAQAARGNSLSASGGAAEAAFKGKAALDLHQQHLQNAGNFLSTTNPIQQISQIQGVSPDRSMSYLNPNAGMQGIGVGQQQYQNQLAAYQMAGGGRNPWAQAAAGGASGAAVGSAFGPWGALIGGVVGAGAGYFSDGITKENVVQVSTSPSGVPICEFNYSYDKSKRYRGAIAQDILKVFPEAVTRHPYGLLTVDYSKTDVTFCEA